MQARRVLFRQPLQARSSVEHDMAQATPRASSSVPPSSALVDVSLGHPAAPASAPQPAEDVAFDRDDQGSAGQGPTPEEEESPLELEQEPGEEDRDEGGADDLQPSVEQPVAVASGEGTDIAGDRDGGDAAALGGTSDLPASAPVTADGDADVPPPPPQAVAANIRAGKTTFTAEDDAKLLAFGLATFGEDQLLSCNGVPMGGTAAKVWQTCLDEGATAHVRTTDGRIAVVKPTPTGARCRFWTTVWPNWRADKGKPLPTKSKCYSKSKHARVGKEATKRARPAAVATDVAKAADAPKRPRRATTSPARFADAENDAEGKSEGSPDDAMRSPAVAAGATDKPAGIDLGGDALYLKTVAAGAAATAVAHALQTSAAKKATVAADARVAGVGVSASRALLPTEGKALVRASLTRLIFEVSSDADSRQAVFIALARFSRAVPADLDVEYINTILGDDTIAANDKAAFLCALVDAL